MVRLLSIVFLSMIALPAMAEQSLSPIQVEALPFDNTLVAEPNTNSISPIDMSEEVELTSSHGEKKAGLPQFDITTFPSQIFWLAIMFVVLYLYFAKLSLPKLSSTIEQRHATIKDDLEQADKISNDVDKTRTDYETAMQTAHDNARATIIDVETHLRTEAETQATAFKEKSATAVAELEKQAETAKAKIKDDLNGIAADLTSSIIEKLSSLSISEADINSAVSTHSDTPAQKTKKAA